MRIRKTTMDTEDIYEHLPLMFTWDVVRYQLNANAVPTTAKLLLLYKECQPWKSLRPKALGCRTEKEKMEMVKIFIRWSNKKVLRSKSYDG